jgi:hypothetical protein
LLDNKEKRKETARKYITRKQTGGVFIVKCKNTENHIIDVTNDLSQAKNRFDFSIKTDLCYSPQFKEDWKMYGKESFVFEILEQLEKGETQTDDEFRTDLNLLFDMWKSD